MPSINLSIPHPFDQATASEKLKGFADVVRERFKDKVKNVHEEWDEHVITFGFTTLGFDIKGSVVSHDNRVDVKTDLPFAAMLFKGKIEQEIREAMQRALS